MTHNTTDKIHKTLYVSDMDGTLLTSEARLSDNTVTMLNTLIDKENILFTVATARTPATALNLLAPLHANVPFITMAGAAWWDNKKQCYTHINSINNDVIAQLLPIYAKHGVHPFIYRLDADQIVVYHTKALSADEEKFIQPRIRSKQKRLVQCETLPAYEDTPCVIIFSMGNYEALRKVADEVKRSKISCSCVCYRDNYDENIGVFEVYAEGTTKAKAINVLADELDIDRIVVFGDNLNDLPKFRIADYSVATGNAFAAVKDEASEVTYTNDEDAVARWIAHDVERQKRLAQKKNKYEDDALLKWKATRFLLALAAVLMVSVAIIVLMLRPHNETQKKLTTKAKDMKSMHDEARTIASDKEWIEGCWLTKTPTTEMSFSIRGGQITISDSNDMIDSGSYQLSGDTLRFKNYTFVLDRANYCIRMNKDIVFKPAGYYYIVD